VTSPRAFLIAFLTMLFTIIISFQLGWGWLIYPFILSIMIGLENKEHIEKLKAERS